MDIDEILEGFGKSSADQYMESSSDSLPPIGSRVCRGPDWMWKNQDSDGPGTVIGHNNDGIDHNLDPWSIMSGHTIFVVLIVSQHHCGITKAS